MRGRAVIGRPCTERYGGSSVKRQFMPLKDPRIIEVKTELGSIGYISRPIADQGRCISANRQLHLVTDRA
jgi:hypothetical protein